MGFRTNGTLEEGDSYYNVPHHFLEIDSDPKRGGRISRRLLSVRCLCALVTDVVV